MLLEVLPGRWRERIRERGLEGIREEGERGVIDRSVDG